MTAREIIEAEDPKRIFRYVTDPNQPHWTQEPNRYYGLLPKAPEESLNLKYKGPNGLVGHVNGSIDRTEGDQLLVSLSPYIYIPYPGPAVNLPWQKLSIPCARLPELKQAIAQFMMQDVPRLFAGHEQMGNDTRRQRSLSARLSHMWRRTLLQFK